MIIEKKKLSELKPSPYNPRQISKEELKKLEDSMEKFGYVDPIIFNKRTGNVVGGHQRLAVLNTKLAPEAEIEVSVVDLDDFQEKALNLALNRITGQWEDTKLAELLKNIQENEKDLLPYTGFDNDEILRLLNQEPPKEKEARPDAIENPKYKISRGEMYQLGKHKLLCGDSTSELDINRIMAGDRVNVCFTDPPYNLSFSGTTHEFREMDNDKLSDEKYLTFINQAFSLCAAHMKSDGSYYVCIDYRSYPIIVDALVNQGTEILNCIVWDKVFSGLGFKYRFRHEFIVFAGDRDKVAWFGTTTDSDVIQMLPASGTPQRPLDFLGYYLKLPSGEYIQIRKIKERAKRIPTLEINEFKEFYIRNDVNDNLMQCYSMNNFAQRDKEFSEGIQHPTMKPIKLIQNCLMNSSAENDLVLDIFGGSGSTLIACEQINRRCNIIEIDPIYCSLIIERWENYTEKRAVKIS